MAAPVDHATVKKYLFHFAHEHVDFRMAVRFQMNLIAILSVNFNETLHGRLFI